jgi:hypothetical protein
VANVAEIKALKCATAIPAEIKQLLDQNARIVAALALD